MNCWEPSEQDYAEDSRQCVVLRVAHHHAKRLLSKKCERCMQDIDSGEFYEKYVAVICGMFYWSCTHYACI